VRSCFVVSARDFARAVRRHGEIIENPVCFRRREGGNVRGKSQKMPEKSGPEANW
jgi:hypothetical protein